MHGCEHGGHGRSNWLRQAARGFAEAVGGWEMERGGRGRRRIFEGADLRLVLLKLIEDKPSHGYELIRAIEERTGGAYVPSPGVIYPTLTLLGEMGLIEEQAADGNRKRFAILPAGVAHLAERADEVTALFARLDAMAAMHARSDSMPARRALHNLRNVLKHRLTQGLDDDTLHEAVAMIDEVARKIERM